MSEEITMSKSKQKREARKAEAEKAKKKKNWDAIIGKILGVAVAAIIIGVIVAGIIQSNKPLTAAGSDYSAQLNDDGTIIGANLNKVKEIALDTMKIHYSDVEYTDDEVQADIDSFCEGNAYFDDSIKKSVKNGDNIQLDYTGYMDGEAFEGGSATDATLEIGSGTFIDTFEEQLIGHHPGETVTVNVTFPEDYTKNPDFSGKPATFEVVIKGIEVIPEFTDELVLEKCEGIATTTEEYRAYLKNEGYKANLSEVISNYVTDNAKVTSYPKAYVKNMKSLIRNYDEQNFQYYNLYYYYMTGSYIYNEFSEYTGMDDLAYEDYLQKTAETETAVDMTIEKYFKDHNLTISADYYAELLESYGEDAETTYGKGYLTQIAMKQAVLEYLYTVVTVE